MTYVIYNDMHLIPAYIAIIAAALITLYAALLVHELGHVMFFKIKKKRNIKLHWTLLRCLAGEQKDYDDLTEKEYLGVNRWGIAFGLVPILISGIIYYPFLLLIIPYGVGIKQDIQEVLKRVNFEDN